jgi:hypothetical protein
VIELLSDVGLGVGQEEWGLTDQVNDGSIFLARTRWVFREDEHVPAVRGKANISLISGPISPLALVQR